MHARFLLGPAGSGKTFRCLSEIRAELLKQPEGPPLILLAPKQATFQLERQLLNDASILGYTRLQILSFERLADFILEKAQSARRSILSEEGRVMVLRALLAKNQDQLKIFRASAGMSGFARQLSQDLRELQRHQITPEKLHDLSSRTEVSLPLGNKLHDLRLLFCSYQKWLEDHQLQDSDCLLDLAAEVLRTWWGESPTSRGDQPSIDGSSETRPTSIAGLWLDGFAEMTPQEISLLAAVAPCCGKLVLAFCLEEEEVKSGASSWLSIWSGINQTRQNCWSRLEGLPGAKLEIELLPGNHPTRFSANPALEHLEKNWSQPKPFPGADAEKSIRLALCPNPQAEAVLAAREILRFVREGGRFRDAAILLRKMEGYHSDLRRVLSNYNIPFFLDRRESVAHHPLAELTRSALSTIAFEWRHEDWFGALKTGLVSNNESVVDQLENLALARGWEGRTWLNPLPNLDQGTEWAERFRQQWILPFARLRQDLTEGPLLRPTGKQLSQALKNFWAELNVEETLDEWSQKAVSPSSQSGRLQPQFLLLPHGSVWEQLNAWLDDIALAFSEDSLFLPDWLPILEAGLSGLSVGMIPPALDQVLIGTVDRSRNPDLKLSLVLGVNETVFPATPSVASLLTETDRDSLEKCAIFLASNTRALLSRERFYGYIACTRSTQRLVLTCAQQNAADKPQSPSPFFSRLMALFPSLTMESFQPHGDWSRAEHICELVAPLLRGNSLLEGVLRALPPCAKKSEQPEGWTTNGSIPALASMQEELKVLLPQENDQDLSPTVAERLYGSTLKTSVSRLEQFAACSFKFFIDSGLRAEERKVFELDTREKGTFQHAVLAEFFAQVKAEHKRWRDLTPNEAREKIKGIAAELAPKFREGMLGMDAESRFAAESMSAALQEFIAIVVGWATQYEFEPEAAELGFGMEEKSLPPWEIRLNEKQSLVFRGVIDRIDLCPIPGQDAAMAVVIDYKSSARKLEKILMDNGLQLQLPAYLSVLRKLTDAKTFFGVQSLIPAGVFFVNLRGEFGAGKTRSEVLDSVDEVRQEAYRHNGRMDFAALACLDSRKQSVGTQFRFKLKKNGEPSKLPPDLMTSEDFDRMLNQVEEHLVRMGREIFGGNTRPNPYQRGNVRACDTCEFTGVCRTDPWTHTFRVLRELD